VKVCGSYADCNNKYWLSNKLWSTPLYAVYSLKCGWVESSSAECCLAVYVLFSSESDSSWGELRSFRLRNAEGRLIYYRSIILIYYWLYTCYHWYGFQVCLFVCLFVCVLIVRVWVNFELCSLFHDSILHFVFDSFLSKYENNVWHGIAIFRMYSFFCIHSSVLFLYISLYCYNCICHVCAF